MNRRRITLQLAPLLDLLLIIIFIQYLEMDGLVADQQKTSAAQLAVVQTDLDQTKLELDSQRADTKRLTVDLATRASELKLAHEALVETDEELDRLREQRNTIVGLLPELFSQSDAAVSKLIQSTMPENTRQTPEQIERLKQDFRRFAGQRPSAALHHLLTFGEMRKHCDIWQLYLTDSGEALLTTERTTTRFDAAETVAEFESRLFQRYKSLPEPKGLVIILFSHGDVGAGVLEAALDGLPKVTRRMQADTGERTRFEYGNLGFTLESPVATKPAVPQR